MHGYSSHEGSGSAQTTKCGDGGARKDIISKASDMTFMHVEGESF